MVCYVFWSGGAAAVAGAAGKLHCGGSKASAGDCPGGN